MLKVPLPTFLAPVGLSIAPGPGVHFKSDQFTNVKTGAIVQLDRCASIYLYLASAHASVCIRAVPSWGLAVFSRV